MYLPKSLKIKKIIIINLCISMLASIIFFYSQKTYQIQINIDEYPINSKLRNLVLSEFNIFSHKYIFSQKQNEYLGSLEVKKVKKNSKQLIVFFTPKSKASFEKNYLKILFNFNLFDQKLDLDNDLDIKLKDYFLYLEKKIEQRNDIINKTIPQNILIMNDFAAKTLYANNLLINELKFLIDLENSNPFNKPNNLEKIIQIYPNFLLIFFLNIVYLIISYFIILNFRKIIKLIF